jgi:hypothetical protein
MIPRFVAPVVAACLLAACEPEPVPPACGEGRWGHLPTGEGAVFVDAQASRGGDGSERHPFRRIQAGLDAAAGGEAERVLVAQGRYPENLVLGPEHGGLQVAGRCAELVHVVADKGGEDDRHGIVLDLGEGAVALSGLTVQDAPSVGIFLNSGAIDLDGVEVTGSQSVAVLVKSDETVSSATIGDCSLRDGAGFALLAQGADATVELSQVEILDIATYEDGTAGYGILAVGGGQVQASGLTVERASGWALAIAEEGSRVELEDSRILDMQPDTDSQAGAALVQGDAALTLRRCQLEGLAHMGVAATGAGSLVELEQVEIVDIAEGNPGSGFGLYLEYGAELVATELEVHEATHCGVVLGFESYGSITDSRVVGTRLGLTRNQGFGVNVHYGSTLEADGLDIEGCSVVGALIEHDARATLRDVRIADTLPDLHAMHGYGIQVSDGATARLEGAELIGNRTVGAYVQEAGAELSLVDSAILDTLPVFEGGWRESYGAVIVAGASLIAERLEVAGCRGAGLAQDWGGTHMSLVDVTVRDILRGADTTAATGVLVGGGGSSVDASRLIVEGIEGPALLCAGAKGRAELRCSDCELKDLAGAGAVVAHDAGLYLDGTLIEGVTPGEDVGGGVGVQALDMGEPATLELSGCTIRDNPMGGVWLQGVGDYRIIDSEIEGGPGLPFGDSTRCGDAVFAVAGTLPHDGSEGLLLEGNTLRSSAGSGVMLEDADLSLVDNSYRDNGVDLIRQGEACAEAPSGYEDEPIASAVLCPQWDRPTCLDEFATDLWVPDAADLLPPPSLPSLGLEGGLRAPLAVALIPVLPPLPSAPADLEDSP